MGCTALMNPKGWIWGQRKVLTLYQDPRCRGVLLPGPRGNGKTGAQVLAIVNGIVHGGRGQTIGIVGASSTSAKSNLLPMMRQAFREQGWAPRYGQAEGRWGVEVEGCHIRFYGGGKLYDEQFYQGQTWSMAVFDELSNITPAAWQMALGNLRHRGRRKPFLVAAFNKRGPLHWTKVDLRDRVEDLGLKTVEWPIDANFHNDADYVARLKASLTGAAYQRFILNQDADEEGLVFGGWQPASESEERRALANMYEHGAVGVDYGLSRDATAAVWLSPVWDDAGEVACWVAVKEYKHTGPREPIEHAKDIIGKAGGGIDGGRRRAWCDFSPSRALQDSLKALNLSVKPPFKKDKLRSISNAQAALRWGHVKISAGNCPRLIEELQSVIWKAGVIKDALDEKVPNDMTDALEYVISGVRPVLDGVGRPPSEATGRW